MTPARARRLKSTIVDHLSLAGTLHRIARFRSRFLGTARDVLVYLPPGYSESQRYPTLYLQDGQNLFDPDTAFAGVHWRVGENLDSMIASRQIDPMIVVGIANTGPLRIHEYTPTMDRNHRAGGGASLLGQMIVNELKPRIDETFSTDPDRRATGIGGSSLGALLSLYVGLEWSDHFGLILAMSPSVWWDRRSILRRIRSLPEKPSTRLWVDTGTSEATGQLPDVRRLDHVLRSKGWSDRDLRLHVEEGAGHYEAAWGARLPAAIEFLYGGESDIP
ncbi:MAG: esterase [Acidobacteria bacterium]|nr:esterase [Acidobacteriota bacterium]